MHKTMGVQKSIHTHMHAHACTHTHTQNLDIELDNDLMDTLNGILYPLNFYAEAYNTTV